MKVKLLLSLLLIPVTATLLSQDYRLISNIPYTGSSESEKQKLDIYIPDNDDLMPCLVWIHGGAWQYGTKDGLAEEIDTLLYHGYVIASIGYRLSDESIFPAQIYDCKSAIRFIKENSIKYNIDSSRIAVAGSSAGGHLAALTGTSSDVLFPDGIGQDNINTSCRVQAVIDFYGPTNFLIMDELPEICKDASIHIHPDSPESKLLGCNIQDCPDKINMANPITYITEDDPPFLIFHGTYDCVVTPESSVLLEHQLKKKNIYAELHLLEGAGHGGEQFLSSEIKTIILDFLNKKIK